METEDAEQSAIEAELRQILDEQLKKAFLNYGKVRFQAQTPYELTELEPLRTEICFSVISGLWLGALCLTNLLLEHFLKRALVYSNMKKHDDSKPMTESLPDAVSDAESEYGSLDLSQTIKRAYAQKLIDGETERKLQEYRERFRNPFAHADMKRILDGKTVDARAVRADTGEVYGSANIPAHLLTPFQGVMMQQIARSEAIPYFQYVDSLVRETTSKIFKEPQ